MERFQRILSVPMFATALGLAWILGRSQALVSHHLRVLREARLVDSRREARMVFYGLTAEATALLDALAGSEVSV